MRLFSLVLFVFLSACGTLNLRTMLAYRNVTLADVDPQTARAILIVPEPWRNLIEPGLGFKVTPLDSSTEKFVLSEDFILENLNDTPERFSIPADLQRQGGVLFALAEEDVPRAQEFRKSFMELDSSKGIDVLLKFQITFGDMPESAFCNNVDKRVQVWIRPSEDYGYRPAFKNRSARQIMGDPEGCENVGDGFFRARRQGEVDG